MASGLSRHLQTAFNAALARRCPPELTRLWLRALGAIFFRRHPAERRRYLAGVRAVLAEHPRGGAARLEERVLAGICEHYFEKLLMAFWERRRMGRFLLRSVRFDRPSPLDDALREGRGAILATGHYGGVEFLPGILAFRGLPVSMVVKFRTARLKRSLEEFAALQRAELIDAAEGQVVPRALAALRAGRIFITVLDEIGHWRPAEVKVMRLFDRRVRLDRSVELLHRRTGAPVLLGLVERLAPGRGYHLVVERPEEHHAAPTRLGHDAQILKRLEHYIYDRPDHWYLWNELHRLDRLLAA